MPIQQWTRLLATNGGWPGRGVSVGMDGYAYVTGNTNGTLDSQASSGESDAFLTKFSPDGTKVWTKLQGSTSFDYATSITNSVDGSIYVAGYTAGSLGGQSIGGSADAFLTKYGPDGTIVWTKLLGNSNFEDSLAVKTGLDGSIYVTGFTSGTLDGQAYAGGNEDAYLTKYIADGTKVWTRLLGTNQTDIATTLSVGIDGSVYVGGLTYSAIDGQPFNGGEDAFLVKYSSNGIKLWTRELGSSGADRINATVLGPDGSVYACGYTTGMLDGQSNPSNYTSFLVKYGSDGTKLWTKLLGTAGYNATSISIGPNGSIYLTGMTNGVVDGQPPNYSNDAFLVQYSSDGVKLSSTTFGTPQNDIAYSVSTSADGSIYIVGNTTGALNGQTYTGGGGDGAVFLVKYQPDDISAYALTSGAKSLNEGSIATYTLTTTNVAAGTSVAYTVSGTGISRTDIAGGLLTGSVTVDSAGKGTISIPIATDQTTEGPETLSVTVNSVSAQILINDTSVPSIGIVPTFGNPIALSAGTGPNFANIGMVTGYFNSDKYQDLAVINARDDSTASLGGSVTVYSGGTGTNPLTKSGQYNIGVLPRSMRVGDINHDGIADLIIGALDNNLYLLYGIGDGKFASVKSVNAATSVNSVAVGDINGDGLDDVVTGSADGRIGILLNSQAIGLTPPSFITTSGSPTVQLADVDGDGKLDLLALDWAVQSILHIYFGNGNGTFGTEVQVATSQAGAWNPVVADINGDGRQDIVFPNYYSSSLTVILGRGGRAFALPSYLTDFVGNPNTLAVADINGDSKYDLVTVGYGGYLVFTGAGDGNFYKSISSNSSYGRYDLALGDFNNDGRSDIAVELSGTTNQVIVALNTTALPVPSYALNAGAASVNEGSTATFTLTTTNLPFGSEVAYTLSGTGITANDIFGGALTGTAVIDSTARAIISVPISSDLNTEGAETLTITVQGATTSVLVNDTSVASVTPTYFLTTASASVNEGSVATFTLTTTNVPGGTSIPYTLAGAGITSGDISGGQLSGSVVVDGSGKASISIPIASDGIPEGSETLLVTAGGKTASILINDAGIAKTGTTGPDSLVGSVGSDTIDGGGGVDTVFYSSNQSAYTLTRSASWTISSLSEGADSLLNMERLHFADMSVALDLGSTQSAGQAAVLLGAVLPGKLALDASKQSLMGAVIGLFDQGYSLTVLAGALLRLDIWTILTGSNTNQAIANYLLTNVNGLAPDATSLANGVNALNSEPVQGTWLAGLAGGSAGQSHIGLSALAQTGLPFIAPEAISPSVQSINEGDTINFALTTNLPQGTSLPYTLSGTGLTGADITGGALSGTVTVNAYGQANVPVGIVADSLTEGAETLVFTSRGLSASVVINDTSVLAVPTYAITAGAANVNEGGTVTFTVSTTNVAAGTVIPYTLSGTGINGLDVAGGQLSGSAVITQSGSAVITVTVASDVTTEGPETLIATVAGKTAQIVINDTSMAAATYRILLSALTVFGGDTLVVTLKTTNLTAGTRVPYSLIVPVGDIVGGTLSGDFIVDASGSASINIATTLHQTTDNLIINVVDQQQTVILVGVKGG